MSFMKSELTVKFVKTHPDAVIPQPAHDMGDAGFDIYAVEDTLLPSGEVTIVKTGLQLADCRLEDLKGNQFFLDIRSRSGLSRQLVFPVTGTVDCIYRGEIGVVLANLGKKDYQIQKGDRIAQMVIQQIIANGPSVVVNFVETDQVTETKRGARGYGSTGT